MISAAFTSFPGLLVFRMILGAFEASISPSMMIIVAMWWTRREQPLRNKWVDSQLKAPECQADRRSIWYSANGLATILGSLLAYGLANIKNTKLYTYQWIFIVNGLM